MYHNFHFQSETISYHGFAIMVCTGPVTENEVTEIVGLSPMSPQPNSSNVEGSTSYVSQAYEPDYKARTPSGLF